MLQIINPSCGFPRWPLLFGLPNAIAFYFLFYDFYQKAYKLEQEKRLKLEQVKNENLTNEQTAVNESETLESIPKDLEKKPSYSLTFCMVTSLLF